ncbi:rhamnose ABC transporter substrate-binding protein [Paenibacillus harenae]|uniref:Rhamnose transport system substrate-binding protein n=1 Tax=Paenibacillus harenae TaxID=306543 RepID=A0ABT9TXQ1_PAEHA|nr:rhamnose ABC transporter substrate-binding protein [Paenibacillus harenae]MDQ0060323.1 rhamnose transport system substrate-binding protein [Paenibacillus harenae]MDQ0112142.1 rhamnose transport system substrate-binding protein [Paenibacillus harenae]
MKKVLSVIIATVMLMTLIAACGSNSGGDSSNGKGEGAGGKQKYAIIFKNTGNPYGEKQMEGYKKAIEELGYEAILKAPDQPTAEAQITMIDELISQKVNSIAIVGNDPDALQPALEKAMKAGIKVLSLDSAVNAKSRLVHVNQADPERIGRTLIQGVMEMIGGSGEIAILSATSQATNQNAWIDWMKKELEDPKYKDVKLVKVAYGDDLRDKSVSETEALLKSYPNLKGIIAPTTVGIAAAGKVITDKGLKGKVQLTGLGLPSEMAEYIETGVCQWMYLWNPIDVGYLAGYAADGLVNGKITGKVGEKLTAGTLGEKEIVQDGDGTQIMLGDPFKFDASNIAEWKSVY